MTLLVAEAKKNQARIDVSKNRDTTQNVCLGTQIKNVALALREMKNKKNPGPTGLTSDIVKFGLSGM